MKPSADEADTPRAPEPRDNPHFEGHDGVERDILAALSGGRVHHAWLITGPRGVGKATLAFRFARHLLAKRGMDAGPGLFGPEPVGDLSLDPADPVFRRVASGGHADLFTLERGFVDDRDSEDDERARRRSNVIRIGGVRDANTFMARTAFEGGWRVVVVDGAEDMNTEAANAMLKTLEEPPDRAILLLVSHAPGRLPPTIRSRCRRLALGRLPDATVEGLVRRYRPDIDGAEARALALIGEGSIGRALQLAEAGGLALYEEMLRQLAGLPRPEAARLHGALEAIARTRNPAGAFEAYEVFADLLAAWMMRQATARARGVTPPAILPGEDEVAARLWARAGLDRWLEVWEKIGLRFARVERLNLDRKQALLDAFFALGRVTA